jgi:hypothetical protein
MIVTVVRAALVGAAAMLFGLGLVGTAAAAPSFKEIVVGSSTNLCNGDEVPLVGKLLIQRIDKPNGDIIFSTHFHATGTGQPSGTEYVLNLHDQATGSPGQPLEVRARATLVSKGGEPNFVTLVIQENGVFTLTQNCRG